MRIRPVALLCVLLVGCAAPPPLSEYAADATEPRQNLPGSYIDYLRTSRFTHGEIDHLPPYAILLHGDPESLLPAAGIDRAWWTTLELGTTDPSKLFIVRPPGGTPFLVSRGTPGAGGAATQTAELAALGARYVVHIGTSGLLGPAGDDTHVIVARAAYKDGAAVLLSDGGDRFARPDLRLTTLLGQQLGPAAQPMVGYTVPIYYFQPEPLIRDLLAGDRFAHDRPTYTEMEEAAVFATADRTHIAAASLTAAADRYTLVGPRLDHAFLDDAHVSTSLTLAVRATIATFSRIAADHPANAGDR
jgi:uridine phosphorylase